MLLDERVESRLGLRSQRALLNQNLAERLGFLQHPSVHRRNQRIPADEVHLQRQDAEEEIAVDV